MRLLHTSDWHLGRTLHGVDLLDAQRAVLSQIVELVAAPPDGVPVDAVVIAGDVYDRAVPPVEAVALLGDVLAELTARTTVIVTAGNHDSAIRLGFGSRLFTERLHVRTALADIATPVMVGGVAIYPLPYLDPDSARLALRTGDEPLARSHQATMQAALGRVHADLASRPAGTPSVVVAHAFVVGGQASDSERSIAVGGVDSISASTFAGFDYVALGHLHGPQQPTGAGHTVLRYSGSPLRYSFSERNQHKSVSVVDIEVDLDVDVAGSGGVHVAGSGGVAGAGSGGVAGAGDVDEAGGVAGASPRVRVTDIPLQQPRPMAELTGELDDLLRDPAFGQHEQSWLRVTVTDRQRPDQLYERVRSRFPHVLQVFHVPAGTLESVRPDYSAADLSPRGLGEDFLTHVTHLQPTDAELDVFETAYREAVAESGRAS